jgi:branched-subunit amino acid ABC-type transport system permease component
MEEANSPNVIFQEIRKIGDFTGKICDMAMIFKANVSGVTFLLLLLLLLLLLRTKIGENIAAFRPTICDLEGPFLLDTPNLQSRNKITR